MNYEPLTMIILRSWLMVHGWVFNAEVAAEKQLVDLFS